MGEPEKTQQKTRSEQKTDLKALKMKKPHANIVEDAKHLWELVRKKKQTKDERNETIEKLMAITSGNALNIIFKHDASRIVQCLLKYGSVKQRNSIAQELTGNYIKLATSQYGKFIILRVLQYCNAQQRSTVVTEFFGNVRKLCRHNEASLVLDQAYAQYATAAQRLSLMQEFYGPEYALFKDDPIALPQLLEQHPLKKPAIMKNLRSVLDSVLEKSTFQLGKIRILHRAILEYLTYTEESTADLIELLKDHLIHMLHTRDGARIAQYCILHAGPKDRKHIVKSFKGLVHAIAKEQYGHTVLLTCFECVDDTVLVGKAIVNELFASKEGESTIQDLLCDKHASTVVMFLLNGRNSKYLPLFVMQELAAADEIRKSTTKKEDSVRSEQLLALVSPLASAAVTEHCNQLMRDKHGSQVVCMAVEHLQGDTKCILDAIVSSLAPTLSTDSLPTQPKEEFNAVKKLRKEAQDAKLVAQGIDMTEPLLLNRFATITFKTLLKSKALGFDKMLYACLKPAAIDWVKYCIANTVGTAGCVYVFISLLEQGDQETIADLKKLCKAEKGLLASIEQPAATPNLNANKRKADHVSPLQLLKSLLL